MIQESCQYTLFTLHSEVKQESKADDFFDKMGNLLFSLFNNFDWSEYLEPGQDYADADEANYGQAPPASEWMDYLK